MNEYKIDKNIPIPQSTYSDNAKSQKLKLRSSHSKLIASMSIGDSFLYPSDNSMEVLNKYYVPANRMGMRIATRKVEGGIRVWRLN